MNDFDRKPQGLKGKGGKIQGFLRGAYEYERVGKFAWFCEVQRYKDFCMEQKEIRRGFT